MIGVIGGSGFYAFLDDAEMVAVDTPYGPPSAPIAVGALGGHRVAFLARHGLRHELAPHLVPYRANAWALRSLGVDRVVAPCACGSLRRNRQPGDLVVLDQLVDRTWGRPDTFVDGPPVNHVSFADPYCPALRAAALASAAATGVTAHDGGTVVVVNGPRFSTRAESQWFRHMGWDVVNMTQHPEAYLARELGLCYVGLALVTDFDTGVEDDASVEPVTVAQVLKVLGENVARTRSLLAHLIPGLPVARDGAACACAAAATGASISDD